MNENLKLPQSVVITGGSDGIGRAMAESFSRRGFKVGLLARRKNLLDEVAENCIRNGATQVHTQICDITDSSAFRKCLENVEFHLGNTDIFIANAGIGGRTLPKVDSFNEALNCFSVNLVGAVDGIEWMKARMVARRNGVIVGISSIAGIRGLPISAAYSASKAGLTVYLESLRNDLRPHGVKVITVAPGFIDTALSRTNGRKPPMNMAVGPAAELIVQGILKEKAWIVIPKPFFWIGWLMKVLPVWLYDRVISNQARKF